MAETLRLLVKELGVKGARCTSDEDDDLAIDASDFATIGSRLPPLRTLRLWKATGEELAAALAVPELGTVRELFLVRNRLHDAEVEALVGSPYLGALVTLDLTWCGLSGRTGALLAAANPRRMPSLRALILSGNRLGASGVLALARSRLIEQLGELDLKSNQAGDAALATFLASRAVSNLETLRLAGNQAADGVQAALASSPYLLRLTALDEPRAEALLERNRLAAHPYVAPSAPTEPLLEPDRPRKEPRSAAALLAQLVVTPSDEVCAVYADWLQEEGDPRGELIALELRLATGDKTVSDKVHRLRSALLKRLQQQLKNKSAVIELHRGLVVGIKGRNDWLLKVGAQLMAQEPIRSVGLNPATVIGVQKLFTLAGSERLTWLSIAHATPQLLAAVPRSSTLFIELDLAAPDLEPFFALPQWPRVRGLQLRDPPSIEELRALVREPRLAQLTRLGLGAYPKAELSRAAEVLLEAPWQLEHLQLGLIRLGDSALAQSLRARFARVT